MMDVSTGGLKVMKDLSMEWWRATGGVGGRRGAGNRVVSLNQHPLTHLQLQEMEQHILLTTRHSANTGVEELTKGHCNNEVRQRESSTL